MYAVIGSPGFERDDNAAVERARLAYDRGFDPFGSGRQLAAVLADRGRKARLGTITAPTLVIHGSADRLVSPSGGREVAKAIPGAEFTSIEGMGHDLPAGVWPPIIDGIVATAARASPAARPAAAR
jgi:pimeloyl-ACP methyl ester carboxylesterase